LNFEHGSNNTDLSHNNNNNNNSNLNFDRGSNNYLSKSNDCGSYNTDLFHNNNNNNNSNSNIDLIIRNDGDFHLVTEFLPHHLLQFLVLHSMVIGLQFLGLHFALGQYLSWVNQSICTLQY
jgi:hypothetical protein